ncbi:hypothetical protein DFJ58DRAFT_846189 [Suillus subalutaceus]|uniref:uncharacterized protein n=1 Tax=Suillus subalutaceus TaxID=48586 RepID=UPI001B87EE83|nr:uncharacterized protein DFJ58DRAFT_846189 [Suillus subalutaceus]KAG1838154.1 hypothetical protein DFJ58DRAFT_846189 [Suillus subalutaceus]
MTLQDLFYVLLDWTGTTSRLKRTYEAARCWSVGINGPFFCTPTTFMTLKTLWCGLLRSRLLVYAYKHVVTSPSSVEREPKATRSGNARLHGMNSVTIASLAYIATQVRFSLSSSLVFSHTDTTTDSETFYHSLLDLLEDPEEYKEIDELLTWWNRYFFSLFAMPLRLIIVTHSAKFSPLPLRPRDPLVPTARYSKSDKNV